MNLMINQLIKKNDSDFSKEITRSVHEALRAFE